MRKLIRLFSITIFIIFIFPFFQTCSDDTILKKQLPREAIAVDDSITSQEILHQKNDSLNLTNEQNRQQSLKKLKDDYTLNGYQLAYLTFSDFDSEDYKDLSFYPMLCFTIILLLSSIVLFLAFKENPIYIFRISIVNLVLLLCAILILVLKEIDDLNQIKYGVYFLGINLIALIILSKRQIKNCC